MLKKISNSFRAFYNSNPPMAIFFVLLLMLALSQWYYRYVSSNPQMQHFVIGVEQGLSVDSIYKLRHEMYNR
jgi:hypothetical protein